MLQDKTAIVTGASAGIGAATALRLHAAGARLVVTARREERLRDLAKRTGAVVVAGDITDPAVRAEVVAAAGERIDILVNNAGYGEAGAVETLPEERCRRQFEVNVFAAGAMIRAVLPAMRRQRAGRIVNLSSVAGRFGYPLFGWYCASKHALEGLSDALRHEVHPWGIRVALVEPGPVETEFFDVTKAGAEDQLADADGPYAGHFASADAIEKELMKQATTADGVARVVVRACTARRPRARYPVTAMAKASLFAKWLLPQSWLDAIIRKQFRVPGPADVG